MPIHQSAVVHSDADIHPSAEIGPYAIIESGVTIAPDSRIYAHAYIGTGTTIGARCHIHPFAVVGHLPQDLKFSGAPTYTRIGDDTIIREHVSIHRGTTPDSSTSIGSNCFLMATSHVGHNCSVGDGVILVNGSMLAGHVSIGDKALVMGNAAIHQFVRVGELAIIGGMMRGIMDVPPFMMQAPPGGVTGVNSVGLRRAGFSPAERAEIRDCFKILYRSGLTFRKAIDRVVALVQTDPGRRLAAFLSAPSKRGYLASAYRRSSLDSEPNVAEP